MIVFLLFFYSLAAVLVPTAMAEQPPQAVIYFDDHSTLTVSNFSLDLTAPARLHMRPTFLPDELIANNGDLQVVAVRFVGLGDKGSATLPLTDKYSILAKQADQLIIRTAAGALDFVPTIVEKVSTSGIKATLAEDTSVPIEIEGAKLNKIDAIYFKHVEREVMPRVCRIQLRGSDFYADQAQMQNDMLVISDHTWGSFNIPLRDITHWHCLAKGEQLLLPSAFKILRQTCNESAIGESSLLFSYCAPRYVHNLGEARAHSGWLLTPGTTFRITIPQGANKLRWSVQPRIDDAVYNLKIKDPDHGQALNVSADVEGPEDANNKIFEVSLNGVERLVIEVTGDPAQQIEWLEPRFVR